MKQYKIEIYTRPSFDDQHRFRVFEINYDSQTYNYKKTIVVSGLDTLNNIKEEINYWHNQTKQARDSY